MINPDTTSLDTIDFEAQNENIFKIVTNYIDDQFPIETSNKTLELKSLTIDEAAIPDLDLPAQKTAKIDGKSWTVPVYGHFILRDVETGKVLDEKPKLKILNMPKVTQRFSMIIDGNEYQTTNQLRLKSGIYTRMKSNGDFESQFNLAKGFNFKLVLNPIKGVFLVQVGHQNYRLYSLLKALGTDDQEMLEAWGDDLFQKNSVKGSEEASWLDLVEKLTHARPKDTASAKETLQEYFKNTIIDPETTVITLGKKFKSAQAETWLATSKKLLAVQRGDEDPDERDSLVFKNLMTVDDLLNFYLEKKNRQIVNNLKFRVNRKEAIRDIISSDTYSKPIKSFFTLGDLTSTPPQTNPVSIISEWRKTTVMGTGGIPSMHSVTMESRNVHPSQINFLDSVNTPDCIINDYELMTHAGWKKVESITKKDKLACLIKNRLEFHTPIEWKVFNYEGLIYYGKSQHIDYAVSPNHRMLTKPQDSSHLKYFPNWRDELITKFSKKRRIFKITNKPYKGNSKKTIKIGDNEYNMRDWASLVGWVISEGYVRNNTVRVSQSEKVNHNNCKRLRNLFTRLFGDSWKEEYRDEYNTIELRVIDKKISNYFKNCGNLAPNKHLPEDFIDWPAYARKQLLLSLMMGDGRIGYSNHGYKQAVYTTTSKKLAEQVSVLITSLGYGVKTACYPDNRRDYYLDIYEIRVIQSKQCVFDPKKNDQYTKHYKGKLYGPKVLGSYILVRRNGSIPYWTGNSGRVGVTLPLSLYVEKDKKGRMTSPILMKSGKIKRVTPGELWEKRIGFASQYKLNELGKPVAKENNVIATFRGKPTKIQKKEIDGYLLKPQAMFGWPSNLMPFMENTQGNRALMASKNITQAFTIDANEAPLVQVKMPFLPKTFEQAVGAYLNPYVPDNFGEAKVTKITNDYIYLKSTKTKEALKVGLYNNFPMNQESFLHSTPTVEVGNTVQSGDELAKNNFEGPGVDDTKALGIGANVQVAYMPYKGFTFEDGVVATESFSKKFAHTILHNFNAHRTVNGTFNKDLLAAEYPTMYANFNSYNKLDAEGIIKQGSEVKRGDVLIAHLEPRELTDEQRILKNMNRAIAQIYNNRAVVYDFDEPGKVEYVSKLGRKIIVRVKTTHPLVEGDKVSNRVGGKGIIVKLIPDDEAPHTQDGKRVDLIMSPFGIPGRMNPSQLLETAAAKIAQKTGKTYVIENFSGDDNLKTILKELKDNNIEADEIMLDKKDGKPLKQKVFTGPQYIMKLMHVVEHKEKSRGYGNYNINESPGRGESGGQAIDPMTNYALLAHGAKWNLYDFSAVKSQKNDELWRALQLGQPVPSPEKPFVFDKMMNFMRGAGVDHVKKGNTIQLLPMTNKKTDELSQGPLTDAGQMLLGKNLAAIKGGLFDPIITGYGAGGKNWSHIELTERMPSPVFEKAIQAILEINKPEYDKLINSNVRNIIDQLDGINAKDALKEAKVSLQNAAPGQVNKYNKKVRFLQTLVDNRLTPLEAYTIKKIPVIPPMYRPIYPLPSGDLMTSPINNHYRAVALINDGLRSDKGIAEESKINEVRSSLYENIKELQGLTDLQHYGKERYEGLLKTLAGTEPKEGLIQNNVWSKRQDLSARSTITLEPSLGVDEVGIPTGIAKDIYEPFAVKKLVQLGYNPLDAKKEIEEESELGLRGLDLAMEERPVLMNRAPSLHKHSIQAFRPKRIDGRAIQLNSLITSGYGADFDGDTMSIFTPVSEKAVEEAYGMLPSKNLYQFGPHPDTPTMPITDSFSQIYQQGLWYLSKIDGKYSGPPFTTLKEAASALSRGEIDENDEIEISGIGKTTYGKELILKPIPRELQDRNMIFDAKTVKDIMVKISRDYPKKFEEIINHFKDLGNRYSYQKPITLSVNDLDIDRSDRDSIMNLAHLKANQARRPENKVAIYNKASIDVKDALYAKARKKNNRFFQMLDSGAQGKPDSVRQILTMPGILEDVYGHPIPIPVEKSWAEGISDYSYWNHLYGARKGTVDRAINTQDSGALNKALLTNLKNLIIVESDCETDKGIDFPADDRNILGRVIQEDVRGVATKGQLITIAIAAMLSQKLGNKKILVRSPLTCESVHGICAHCYGLTPEGRLPRVGENVGVLDSQAITERSTQLVMRSFHSGGAALAGGGVTAGFPELQRSLEVPATLPGAATLATQAGKVEEVRPSAAGGFEVDISGKIHVVKPGREVLVQKNQWITKGQVLSTGVEKPQEVAELRNFLDAQRGLVNRMNNVYEDKFSKRTFETVIRGVSNNAMILDPKDSEFLRGSTIKTTLVEAENKKRAIEGKPPIEFKKYFKSIQVLPHETDDWLSRLGSNNIKRIIQESAARGSKTNIHGVDPLPPYLYGYQEGLKYDPEKGIFW